MEFALEAVAGAGTEDHGEKGSRQGENTGPSHGTMMVSPGRIGMFSFLPLIILE
jgi:hypothetical protein